MKPLSIILATALLPLCSVNAQSTAPAFRLDAREVASSTAKRSFGDYKNNWAKTVEASLQTIGKQPISVQVRCVFFPPKSPPHYDRAAQALTLEPMRAARTVFVGDPAQLVKIPAREAAPLAPVLPSGGWLVIVTDPATGAVLATRGSTQAVERSASALAAYLAHPPERPSLSFGRPSGF